MLRRVASTSVCSLLWSEIEAARLPVNALEGRVSLGEEPELHIEVVARCDLRTGKSLNGMPDGFEPVRTLRSRWETLEGAETP
jgi:hypothetical protein